jgi:hypothetical protein
LSSSPVFTDDTLAVSDFHQTVFVALAAKATHLNAATRQVRETARDVVDRDVTYSQLDGVVLRQIKILSEDGACQAVVRLISEIEALLGSRSLEEVKDRSVKLLLEGGRLRAHSLCYDGAHPVSLCELLILHFVV